MIASICRAGLIPATKALEVPNYADCSHTTIDE